MDIKDYSLITIYIVIFPILVVIITTAIFVHPNEAFLKQSSSGTIEESMANYAKITWRYFKPVGVNPNTAYIMQCLPGMLSPIGI